MLKRTSNFASKSLQILCVVVLLSAGFSWAIVGGSISGTVKDPSGRVIANADVSVREVGTGLSYQTHSDGKGSYTLPVLPVGRYELDVQAAGFRTYQRKDV